LSPHATITIFLVAALGIIVAAIVIIVARMAIAIIVDMVAATSTSTAIGAWVANVVVAAIVIIEARTAIAIVVDMIAATSTSTVLPIASRDGNKDAQESEGELEHLVICTFRTRLKSTYDTGPNVSELLLNSLSNRQMKSGTELQISYALCSV